MTHVLPTAETAVTLARLGWHVFTTDHPSLPTCAGVPTPAHNPATCNDRGKHPCSAWSRTATADVAVLAPALTALTTTGPRNLGIACGPSGLIVVDEDVDGEFARYATEHQVVIPDTFRVRTGKGQHYYFAAPPGVRLGNAEGALATYGVNIRGDGGYVIAPGSTHASGATYTVISNGVMPAPCPDWLVEALTPAAKTIGRPPAAPADATDPDAVHTGRIDYGHRYTKLVSYAGRLRERGLSYGEAMQLFFGRWLDCVQPPGAIPEARYHDEAPYDVTNPVATWESAVTILDDVWRRYPAGLSEAEKWDMLGVDVRQIAPAPPSASGSGLPATDQTVGMDRPLLRLFSPAESFEWMRDNAGHGGLAELFDRAGKMVYTPYEGQEGYVPPSNTADHDGPAQFRTIISGAQLQARVQVNYHCYTEDAAGNRKRGLYHLQAATVAVNAVDKLSHLRRLRGVTHTPILRADGSLLARPGYDNATGLLYLPLDLTMPEVPESPSAADVARARDLLHVLVCDFRFVSEHDRANYLGMLLTPLVREMVGPPYKLGAIGAPQPGSGKTLLATILRLVHGGVFRAEMPEDEAELRKQVTTILETTTGPIVQIDNVAKTLRSSTLAGLLTSAHWDDRRLGGNEMVRVANDRLWVITGNNLSMGGDLPRRALWCTIDPGIPDPHLRTHFAIPNLEVWVREHRGDILHALLTLARTWVVAGRPTTPRAGDGYARWVEAIDGILTTAGVPGQFDDRSSIRQPVGSDDDAWADFLAALHAVFGGNPWTTRQLVDRLETAPGLPMTTGGPTIPYDVLPGDLAGRSAYGGGLTTSLGRWLMNRDGRWAGGYVARAAGRDHSNVRLWRVETTGGYSPVTKPSGQNPEQAHYSPNPDVALPTTQTPQVSAGVDGLAGVVFLPKEKIEEENISRGAGSAPASPATPAPAPPTPTPAKPARKGRLTPEEKAERAAARKAETAARKAQDHQAAIEQAAGEHYDLPAVVDRAGTITSVAPLQAGQLLTTLIERDGELTVDVETTGYPLGHADYALKTIQVGGEDQAVVFDAGVSVQITVAAVALADAPVLHAHSATADLGPLAHAGLIDYDEAWARMDDTVIAAKLADPTSTGSDPGLKKLSTAVLREEAVSERAEADRAALFAKGKWLTDTEVTTPIERSGWAQSDPTCATMIRYAGSDVLDTAALARRLPKPTPALLERERGVQAMTARLPLVGLRLDGAHIAAKTAEHLPARDDALARVQALGVDNPGSDKQVGTRLTELGVPLPRTATGKLSVAQDSIESLRGTDGAAGALVDALLDFRHHDKVLSTYLRPYAQLVVRGDGRVRPTIYTMEAKTGRMSSVRPNVQNIPRQGGMRACITADPGYLLISADFSGVEIRTAAALSQDQALIKFILDEDAGIGDGLHWAIARQVWGPDATKANRYSAKRIVFGRFYGGGVETLAAQAGVSTAVTQQAIDVLDALAPTLRDWSWGIRNAVKAGRTQFPAYSGRVIHLRAPHAAPNYCIQGTARELTVDALLRWRDTRWGDALLWPVHDEIVAMVPAQDAEEATVALVKCMRGDLYGVPIVPDPSTPSFAWADAA